MPIPTTRDFSVKFGRQPDMGLEGQKAFPFIYTFVNQNDNQWVKQTSFDNAAEAQANLQGLGPLVPHAVAVTEMISGVSVTRWQPGYRNVNVLLDADYNYKLLSVRYTTYNWVADTHYAWYENQATIDAQYPYINVPTYDPTAATPPGPAAGDTYKALATANGWTINNIYRWSGAAWVNVSNLSTSPYFNNYPVFVNTTALPNNPTVGDTYQASATANGWVINKLYRWSGTAWTNITANAGTVHEGDVIKATITANGLTINKVYQYISAAWVDVDGDTFISDGLNPDMDNQATSLNRYIKMTLSLLGSGSTVLYGGKVPYPDEYRFNRITGGTVANDYRVNDNIPLPLDVLQGYDSGVLTMRTPYLLPRQGIMSFDIYNFHHTKDITVGAAIYGMKVRV